ncbi:MAG TPA: glycosyltransferase [Gemmatimonadales bacterium]|nr:glycosyltransferase [Gemmatimonadales bacterium]
MKVALVHHARLPVRGYGGTERVVVWLARGLLELGHEVTLLSAPGSAVPGVKQVPIPAKQASRAGFDARSFIPKGIDVVHAHQEIADPGVPWCWTMHGNAREGHILPPNTIGLSADHARRHRLAYWVHNGLDPDEHVFLGKKKDFDLFLGRLHSVKGWQWAVEAARRAERKMVIAGGWRPVVSRWVRFAGSVEGQKKAALLSEARILWAPAQWDEPFGLTSIEALASGTPVLGTRRGALPEIVTPETGATGETLEELLQLIPGVEKCDPEACRDLVRRKFHYRVMAERYAEIYKSVG